MHPKINSKATRNDVKGIPYVRWAAQKIALENCINICSTLEPGVKIKVMLPSGSK
jgi:hypothetical protein